MKIDFPINFTNSVSAISAQMFDLSSETIEVIHIVGTYTARKDYVKFWFWDTISNKPILSSASFIFVGY